MPRDLIAGPAGGRERQSYYRGGGKGGGGAFGRRSLLDADFESMLPGYADALLGSGLNPDSRAGAGDVAARAADVAKAKLKLQLGGGAVTPYDPEEFANVRPGVFDPRRTVPIPRITIRKPAQRAKMVQAIVRDMQRMRSQTGTSRSSTYGSGIRGGGMGSSYGSRGYQGGTYGGAGGRSITEGVGGAFKNR